MIRPPAAPYPTPRSKPCASGDDPPVDGQGHGLHQVNPARAGMILPVIRTMADGGSKPRASGDDPPKNMTTYSDPHVNPARAGMIRTSWGWAPRSSGKPRASGDDPDFVGLGAALVG